MSGVSRFLLLVISVSASLPAFAVDNNSDAGKKDVEQSCQLCHSVRLVESQRLSTTAWQKEVDKMIGWGAVVRDKQAMVNYLSEHYGNTLPPPPRVLSSAKTR